MGAVIGLTIAGVAVTGFLIGGLSGGGGFDLSAAVETMFYATSNAMRIVGKIGVAMVLTAVVMAVGKVLTKAINKAIQAAKRKKGNVVVNQVMAVQPEAVFWSGGREARVVAENFAQETGRTTLEMSLQNSGTDIAGWGGGSWDGASAAFAQSAVNSGQKTAHVFINEAKFRGIESVWTRIELPIIEDFMRIIFHFV